MVSTELRFLRPELPRVESAMREAVSTTDPFLSDVATHLMRAGGKRLRPALAMAAACVGTGAVPDAAIQGGVSVELVHLGSLYHDDVMDEADTRRGVVSANARWGNLIAILAGDFLLAKSSVIAASLGTEVAGLIGATIGRLCEGQVLELQWAFNPERPEDSYFSSINGKTASLMAAACRVGGIVAGLDRLSIDALTAYGEAFGMTFQIADDILDLIATDEQLGKPAGNDVIEGTYTLPVLRALRDPSVGEELRSLLTTGMERHTMERVRKLVRGSVGIDEAMQAGRCYAASAAAALRKVAIAESPHAAAAAAELAAFGDQLLDQLPV